MSCPFSPLAASHDSSSAGGGAGGSAAAAMPAACPFSGSSQQTAATASTETTPPATKDGHIDETKLCPIPQPPTRWLTGNLSELTPAFPTQSIWRLASIYGDIYQLDLITEKVVIVSSNELGQECLDTKRFDKVISGGLVELRDLLGDGLFTAHSNEKGWEVAHRILMPVFGPLAIRGMFPKMLDMVSQMILRWERLGPDNEIVASDDFTRLAFDTIGFCGFSYRFNSFYSDNVHPFAQQMADYLIESGKRANRTSLETHMRIWSAEERRKNRDAMWKLCDELVADRKRNPQPDVKDLLNAMLYGKDPETGETMSDELIRFNMVTFLVAGHETTSGTLSFLFYHLLKSPEIYQKAQAEVDRVVGDEVLQLKHLSQLKYLEACIRETLRFQGPIGINQVYPKQDTIIGGKYLIKKGQTVRINLPGLHHDVRVWGDDHSVFRPERLLDGRFEALPNCAWKPFGNGKRACIGRGFAEQEMLMAAAMTLQRFQVHMVDPTYDLRLKSTLTVKPADFNIKVSRRQGKDFWVGVPGSSSATTQTKEHLEKTAADAGKSGNAENKNQLLVLYGSNAGTCKYLAEDMATVAGEQGMQVTVKTMDAAASGLPRNQPVVIITPSYEGRPADNAAHFVNKVENATPGSKVLNGVQHAIFGVGNSEWTATFHRIPKILDGLMPQLGSKAIVSSGYVDVKEDLVGVWEEWRDGLLAALRGENAGMSTVPAGEATTQLTVTVEKPQTAIQLAGEEISEGVVLANKEIASKEVGPAKRHMEVELPAGMAYEPGDYLVVLPINPRSVVTRVCNRFKVNLDDVITIQGTSKGFLKSDHPITLASLLYSRVELSTPASKRQVEATLKTVGDTDEQKHLEKMVSSDESFKSEILSKRKSVIDILEDFPSAQLPLPAYLDMLKPLAPRQYSISSSPLGSVRDRDHQHSDLESEGSRYIASITYDVHGAPAHSGNGRVFEGVCSTYLANHAVGSKIRCYVRRTNGGFHLPADPAVPIIMIGAGTGLAPFRGFIQERACLANAARSGAHAEKEQNFGPALMYFGCRDAEKDYIYREELEQWEAQGVVQMRPAFSRSARADEDSSPSWRYVHQRMWEEREELSQVFRDGGKIYVCGSASKLAKSAMNCVVDIWMERHPGATREEALAWLQETKDRVRYVSDVFD